MDDMKGHILVMDDEAELRSLLSRYLGKHGYRVRAVEEGTRLDTLLAREHFDVLVLDVMMPGEDGLSLCRRLRASGETIPILMLTARGDPVDRILGLEMGADDYLPKPFEPRELLARIEALLRRQQVLGAHLPRRPAAPLQVGPYQVQPESRRLLRDGTEIPLGDGEFDLLCALLANPGRPLSRERLIELAHGRHAELSERSIDVQILRLRRLLETDPANPRLLLTVRGKGYLFNPAADASP